MKNLFATATLAILLVIGLTPSAHAQTANDSSTLQALLKEVHQLRMALERSAVLGPKMQLTVQRMQLQEQKIGRLSSQLDAVRKQIAEQTAMQARAAEELGNLDQQISAETDQARRKQMEEHRAVLRKLSSRPEVDVHLRSSESELASALRTEQAVFDELSEKLNTIERMLESPPKQ